MNYYVRYHFMVILMFQEKKMHLKSMLKPMKYKLLIINESLSDSLSVSKNNIKNLFDELLRGKKALKYVLSTKMILKKRLNDKWT